MTLSWLPPAAAFKERLHAATSLENGQRLEALTELSQSQLGFLQEIQLDRALVQTNTSSAPRFARVRLALLSSCTINQLVASIRVAALRRRLLVDIYEGQFGLFRQEILSADSSLSSFRPEFVLISLVARDALPEIGPGASELEVEDAVRSAVDELRQLWRAARERFGATVIQQTLLDRSEPLFGSFERLVPGSPARLVARLNDRVAQACAEDGVLLLDVAQAAARDGLAAWFDTARWLQGKMEIAPAAATRYAELLTPLLAAALGRARKCLVLDLDNTLWGGVIGDDGLEGLVLGPGNARGEAHLALQRYARALKERGVILAICSKNDPVIAEAAFQNHPEMLLRPEDIAVFVANWNDKVENLKRIAGELNIGLDSLVFVDDNPAERERVRQALPEVAVPELPADPAYYVSSIAEARYFEAVSFTQEDRQRTEHYATNAQREALRERSQNVGDFLRGLEMSLFAGPVKPVDIARVVQLINKTNQFNTTTRRTTVDEFHRFMAGARNLALQFRLLDRFGDNGLVSVVLLQPATDAVDALEICNWVMSCRVFGRQLEDEALNIATEQALARGARRLVAQFVQTTRNGVVSDLYRRLGFDCRGHDGNGTSSWQLDLQNYKPRSTFIKRATQSE